MFGFLQVRPGDLWVADLWHKDGGVRFLQVSIAVEEAMLDEGCSLLGSTTCAFVDGVAVVNMVAVVDIYHCWLLGFCFWVGDFRFGFLSYFAFYFDFGLLFDIVFTFF